MEINEKTQKEKFVELIKSVSDQIEKIDNETISTSMMEPEWWLDMIEIQRKVIECKMKYLKYEI